MGALSLVQSAVIRDTFGRNYISRVSCQKNVFLQTKARNPELFDNEILVQPTELYFTLSIIQQVSQSYGVTNKRVTYGPVESVDNRHCTTCHFTRR